MAGVCEGGADGATGAAAYVDYLSRFFGCKLVQDPIDGGDLRVEVGEGLFVGGADRVEELFCGEFGLTLLGTGGCCHGR